MIEPRAVVSMEDTYEMQTTIIKRMRDEYEKLMNLKWLWQHCTDMVQKQTIYIEMRYSLSFVRSYNSVNLEDDSEATVITLNTSDVLIRCHGTMQE